MKGSALTMEFEKLAGLILHLEKKKLLDLKKYLDEIFKTFNGSIKIDDK